MNSPSVKKTKALCKVLSSTGKEDGLSKELKEWWYYRRRKVRAGWVIPEEEMKVLMDFQIPWLYSRSAYTILEEETSRKYFQWILSKGEEPKANQADAEEHRLYRWMYRKRHTGFHRKVPVLSMLPNVGDKPLSREEKALYDVQEVVSWVLRHKRVPSSKVRGEEGRLGKWLLNKKQYYKEKGLGDTVSILLRSAGML